MNKTNWPLLISELESAGVGISKIVLLVQQAQIKCQYTQINRLVTIKGSQPLHDLGECIKEIHETYIREPRADIPGSVT